MRKIFIIEFVIIVLTLVIVLPLVFLATQSTSVAKTNETITGSYEASRYLSFDLKKGQTVKGSYTIKGYNSTFCVIVNPNGDDMVASPTDYQYDGNHAIFSFTADIDGQYYLSISNNDIWTHYIDYEYSISSPPILGFDPIVLIGLVITIATVLTLINALLNLYLPHRRKKQGLAKNI